MYKYEMHCHSSECSLCAVSSSADMVRAYHAAGYAGLVLTDHFVHGNTAVPRDWPWGKRMRRYYESYLLAKAEGDKLDFDVFFGLEHAYGDGKEVLTYGIDLDFLLANTDLDNVSIEEYAKRVHDYGGYIVQAHPYRDRSYIRIKVPPKPELLDGVEVYNDANLPEENEKAEVLARKYDLDRLSGSDLHHADGAGKAGMAFPHRICSVEQLLKALRGREGRLIVNGKIIL